MQEVARHGSCPTKPNLTTPDFVGELPRRTTSVSDEFRLPQRRQSHFFFQRKITDNLD